MNEPEQTVLSFESTGKPVKRRTDYTGQTFGRWLVLRRLEERYMGTHPLYECRCECGTVAKVRSCLLPNGHSRSCGCLQREAAGRVNLKHGGKRTRTYRIWCAMKTRCTNPKQPHWEYYGGRGIGVCDRWMNSFKNFLADMGEPPLGMSLDRIDGAKNYAPDNCRWATVVEQANNKSSNHCLTHDGLTLTIMEWSRRTGFHRSCISMRLKLGWSIERALTVVPTPSPRRKNSGCQ